MASLQDQPNPFAQFATAVGPTHRLVPSQSARRSLRQSAIRWILIAGMAAGLAVAATHSPRYLVAYLAKDLETLPADAQYARLVQIASIGRAGLPIIIDRYATGDADISRVCEQLLSETQNGWTTLPIQERLKKHQLLLNQLTSNISKSPQSRYVSIRHLLRQSLQDLATREEPAAIELRMKFASLVDQLTPGSSSQAIAAANTNGQNGDATKLLARRAAMVIASGTSANSTWTQWPPDGERGDQTASPIRAIDAIGASTFDPVPQAWDTAPSATKPQSSSAIEGLQPVPDPKAIVLRPAPKQAPNQDIAGLSTPLPAAPMVADPMPADPMPADPMPVVPASVGNKMPEPIPPMAALADVSVFVYLHSQDVGIRSAAELELRSRRYNDAAMQLARIAGSPDPADRMALASQLPTMSSMDPRPWLALLCSDPDRQVRMQAISVVATFDDPDAQTLLRRQLDQEKDSQIAHKLRRILRL